MLRTIYQFMVVEMAFEKVNNLEKKFNEFQVTITTQISQVTNVMKMSHELMREDPSIDAHIEGESNHHIHFHGNHHPSSH